MRTPVTIRRFTNKDFLKCRETAALMLEELCLVVQGKQGVEGAQFHELFGTKESPADALIKITNVLLKLHQCDRSLHDEAEMDGQTLNAVDMEIIQRFLLRAESQGSN